MTDEATVTINVQAALKPCPFCGSEVKMVYIGREWELHHPINDCFLGHIVATSKDPREMVEQWNRRAIELETKPLRYDVVEVVACSDGPITGPSWEGSETWYDAPVVKFSSEDREEAVRYMGDLPIGTRAYIKCIREHQEIVWKKDVLGMDWKRPRLPLHPHREPSFEPLSDGRHVLPDLNVEVTVENGVHTLRPLEGSDTVRQCDRCGCKHPMDEMLRFVDVDTEKDVYICWSCWMGGSQ